jgi:transposase, IS605 OrfB family, central region
MFKAFKYRLEPNANQTRELGIALETHRQLYNVCLEQRKTSYETAKKSIRYTEQSAWFKTERYVNPWFAKLNFSSAQTTMRRLDKSFCAFFRRVKSGESPGYPRFKGRDHFNSFTYPSITNGARVIGNKLRLQHVGMVRINLHRPIEGQPKTTTIKREAGKWYMVVCCELLDVPIAESVLPAIGIDLGIEKFLTASDGYTEPSLQPLKPLLPKLRIEQRSLCRKKKGAASRRKQRKVVARLHAKVRNTRCDQHHKIANRLTSRYGAIAVESLNIRGMLGNRRLARAVSDAGWSSFLTILKHHAESAGVRVVEVDARGTSQTCPECGAVAQKALSQRKHICGCGYSTHRDHAAARVILSRGQAGMQPGGRNVGAVMPHGLRSRLF